MSIFINIYLDFSELFQTLREENILPELHCEDYRDGYDDDASPTVTPMSLVRALGEKVKGKSEPLDTAMSCLFVTRLGVSGISVVKGYVAEELFPLKNDK